MNMFCGVKLSSVRSRLHVSWWHLQILTCTNLHHVGGSWSFTSGPHLAVWVLPWLVAGRCSFFRWKLFPNRCTRTNWFLAELQLARAATSTLRPSCFFCNAVTNEPVEIWRMCISEVYYAVYAHKGTESRKSTDNFGRFWWFLMHSSHAHWCNQQRLECHYSIGRQVQCSHWKILKAMKSWWGNLEPWDAIGDHRDHKDICRIM